MRDIKIYKVVIIIKCYKVYFDFVNICYFCLLLYVDKNNKYFKLCILNELFSVWNDCLLSIIDNVRY